MSVNVMMVFSNKLLSYAIAKLFEGDTAIDAAVVDPDVLGESLQTAAPDVVLTDIMTLYRVFNGNAAADGVKVMLVDTGCTDANLVAAVVDMKVRGVLAADTTSGQLKKAALTVAAGDLALDMASVKGLIEGIRTRRGVQAGDLTRREQEVISLVGTGCRNKEIASRLHISEATVKAHLSRIFNKLGVTTRSKLVSMTAGHSAAYGLF